MTLPAITARVPQQSLNRDGAVVAVIRTGRLRCPDNALSAAMVRCFSSANPEGFASAQQNGCHIGRQNLPSTDEIRAGRFDLRLPLTFTLGDFNLIADHILHKVAGGGALA